MADGGKGAIPKKTVPKQNVSKTFSARTEKDFPFQRTKKTARTPPKEPVPVCPANESIYLCQICLVEDGVEKIQCDKCTLWYHFICAKLSKDVLKQDIWLCFHCVEKQQHSASQEDNLIDIETANPSGDLSNFSSQKDRVTKKPVSVGRKSGSVTSSVSRRAALALQRLEEERKLLEIRDNEARERQRERDKDYLNQKYSILEDDVMSNLSYDDQEVDQHKFESIRQWATNIPIPDNNNPLVREVPPIDNDLQLIQPQLNSTIVNQPESKGETNVMTSIESSGIRNNFPPASSEVTTSHNIRVDLPIWLTKPSMAEPVTMNNEFVQLNPMFTRESTEPIKPTPGQLSTKGNFAPSSVTSSIFNVPTAETQPTTIVCQQQGGIYQSISQVTASHQQNVESSFYKPVGLENIGLTSSCFPVDTNRQSITGQQHLQSSGCQSAGATVSSHPNYNYVPIGSTSLSTIMSNDQIVEQIIGRNRQEINVAPQSVDVNYPRFRDASQLYSDVSKPQAVISSQSQFGHSSGSFQTLSNNRSNHISQMFGFGQSGQSLNTSQPYIYSRSQAFGQSSNYNGTSRSPYTSQPNSQTQLFGTGQTGGTSQLFSTNQPYSQPQSFGFGQSGSTNQLFSTNQPYSQSQSFGFGQSGGTSRSFNASQPYSQSQLLGNSHQNQSHDINNSIEMCESRSVGTRLTAEQIAARHVMPKDLPDFYGDPLEWEAFISAYENSTSTCGFTNSENLGRLQRCLKGDAKTAVKSRLFHRDSVPGVIGTLRLLYGRPEQILEKMISEIQKMPAPSDDDLPALIRFAIAVQNLSETIQHVGEVEHLRNPTLINSITDKLPTQHRLNWAFHKQTIGNANVGHLGDWLYRIADVASRVVRVSTVSNKQVKRQKSEEVKKSSQKSDLGSNPDMIGYVNAQMESNNKTSGAKIESTSKSTRKCPVCEQSSCQRVKECQKFSKLTLKERWAMVKLKELCFRCFGHHQVKKCKSKQKCNVGDCQKAHNPLLHDDEKIVVNTSSKCKSGEKKNETTNVNCSHLTVNRHVDIFRIVPVKLCHNEKSVETFAYLDDGSNVTTMENDLANELNLDSSVQENLCVKWSFGKIRREELVSRKVSVCISGVQTNALVYELHNVRTVNDLALPSQTITRKWLDSYEHLKGIPITTYENAKPRRLIGLQYSKLMVSQKSVEGNWSEPIACKTRLGWIVQGPDGGDDDCDGNNFNDRVFFSMNICECEQKDSDLHSMVKEFFSWENFGIKITDQMLESKDIQRARKILESTTKKIQGRYETGLLWRYDDVKFPETYPMALKRLECLERKMEKDPILAKKMCEYIQDFINKGYVRKLTSNEVQTESSRVCYLPIFPVFNPKKPEKFRIVWDAAAMVNKISLNSMLLAGPDLLIPLPDVLRRFRERDR